MKPFEMTDEQRRIFIDAVQLHQAYTAAFFKSRSYRGGMHWKKAKGKEYLFRSLDRYGYGKSLGPRSKETETIHKLWVSEQKNREAVKKKRDRSQARAVCKLIQGYLPEFQFRRDELRMFPKDIVSDAAQAMEDSDLPPGYGT